MTCPVWRMSWLKKAPQPSKEMERLVRERAGDQEELLKLRQQLRNMEQQLPDPKTRGSP